MRSPVLEVIRESKVKKPEKYTILTFPTHERYETQLSKTGHEFYGFTSQGQKKWDTAYADLPENYYILPEGAIFGAIHFDAILSQSKFGQFQIAQQLQQALGVPIISLEHTLPIPDWPEGQKEAMAAMTGQENIFISEYSRREWGVKAPVKSSVIHHSVDSNLFKPKDIEKKPYALSVVNDFKNRDYCCNYTGWQRITQGLDTKVVGSCSEGLSQPAPSIEALVDEYNSAQIFLNTSTVSPVPTSLLEAMSCGCAVVTTATCMIPEIIVNGENGFMSNDEAELRGYIDQLLADEDLRKRLGVAARETVLTNFSEQDFIKNWNDTFDGVLK